MFSIIMPTYNCEKYVLLAVQSVLSQTYGDFELIIVDDASRDSTFEVLKDIPLTDKRVRLYQIPHVGVSAARNYGIEQAQGENVLFIDGDDCWKPNLLEHCVLESEFEMLLFGIQSDWYNADDTLAYSEVSMDSTYEDKIIHLEKNIDSLISTYNMASPCNKVYKRDILQKFNVRFSLNCVYMEDFKFNLDYLCHIAAISIINENLYLYRLHIQSSQLLKRNFREPFINADEIVHSADALLKNLGIDYTETPILVSILLKLYYGEFCYLAHGKKNADIKKALTTLNSNQYYKRILKYGNGKFLTILKLLSKCRCYRLQAKVIMRRYY